MEIPTVLGPGSAFEGLLSFRGEARVEGALTGDVIAEGRLVVAPGARLKARIRVDELVVAGEVEGDVEARGRVELLATGRLVGRLRAPRLAVAAGGILSGRCEAGRPPEGAAAGPGETPAGTARSG